ncbi:MAG TPA: helix-turn-helix domain-containing protein [Candidatus Moranbacteria bacterium]|nr:helix-turn-helix domain-containing protein [Candidatus Moranbacteria bacterium]
MKIDKILNLFDLHPAEKDVFGVCLESAGGIGATEISKKIGMNRTSVYDFLDNLIATGLIIESQKFGKKIFFAQKPEQISLLIKEKQKEIIEAQNAMPELTEEYYSKGEQIKPRLQIYEGNKELQQMMKDLLLYENITIYSFWSVKNIVKLLGEDFFKDFQKQRIKQNIYLKVIWPAEHLDILKKYAFLKPSYELKRDARIAPKNINFSLSYTIYKNTVRFISSKKENYGFLIESEEMADMMKKQFDIIWEKSKPIKK